MPHRPCYGWIKFASQRCGSTWPCLCPRSLQTHGPSSAGCELAWTTHSAPPLQGGPSLVLWGLHTLAPLTPSHHCLVGCTRCYSMAELLRSSHGSSRPRCSRQHLLKRFSVTYAMRVLCDGCDREMPTNAIVHGCRQCDVDYCSVGGSGWCQSLELLEWRCHTAEEEGPACPCRDGNPALARLHADLSMETGHQSCKRRRHGQCGRPLRDSPAESHDLAARSLGPDLNLCDPSVCHFDAQLLTMRAPLCCLSGPGITAKCF